MSTIGSIVDKLCVLRDDRRALEKQIEVSKKESDALEITLMESMDKEGVDKATGKHASVSIGETVRPNVADWDEFYKYIYKTKAFFLLERRPSVTACRELFETKGKIPGVVPFTKRSINLRTRE